MSEIGVEVLDPRHDPEPPYWETLRKAARLHANWAYSLIRIHAWHRRCPLLLTVLRQGDDVLGVVCAQWSGPPARPAAFVAAGRRRPWLGALDVQSPQSTALPGWWFSPGLDREGRRAMFDTYRRVMRRALGVRCRGVLWRQVPDEDLPVIGRWRMARPTDAVTALHTPWSDVEGWLGSLSRSRRTDIRRQGRIITRDLGISVSVGSGRDLDPAELCRLVRHNEAKYTGGRYFRLPMSAGWLAALLRRDDVVVVCYRDGDGRVLGFQTLLDHPDWPLFHLWAALPPEQGGQRHLYFDSYRRAVEWATGSGKRGLLCGKTHLDVKAALGCVTVAQHAVAVLR